MSKKQTQFWFWMIVLSAAAAVYFLVIVPKQREQEAQRQSAAVLGPIISADPRFPNVEVHCVAEGPFFFLTGKVSSQAALEQLKKLVAETTMPRKPQIDIHVPDEPR